jgi:excisionase family DNA binding protein
VAKDIQQQTMFGISELAQRWGVSAFTVRRAISRGELRALYFSRRILVPRLEVERVELVGFGRYRQPKDTPVRAVAMRQK